MKNGALFWLIVFGISASLFFVIAAVVAYKGLGDLRVLLRDSSQRRRE